jgi:anti-sigma regulatory factor (Ser/Thr protein kinase)
MNATSADTSATLNRQYAGEAATLRVARRDVVNWLTECGADSPTIERASLITSELASNAIQAAPGRPYQLRVSAVAPNAASLSIRNHATEGRPPPRADWRPVDDLAIRGRGLSIVDSLSDEVTVEADGDEVVVTAWFRMISSC